MKARQLEKMGVPPGLSKAVKWMAAAAHQQAGLSPRELRQRIGAILGDPEGHREDPYFGDFAVALAQHRQAADNADADVPLAEPVPWRQWGEDLDANAIQQMRNACQLPVAVRAALMPDAHLGYGLPIGGVLATDNAVVPYAVGVDIACRMKLTVLDLPVQMLRSEQERLINAIEAETRFGVGASFSLRDRHRSQPREHPVLDMDWSVSPITKQNQDKARAQLGTSGSGNHFVEFGEFTVDEAHATALQLPGQGTYLALLSHSGSRGVGASVCDHYSKLAMDLHPNLPRELRHLAWLSLDTHEGQEYWAAMNLMGEYAAANHACIHQHIARHLGAGVLLDVENHHNFAWKETHVIDGKPRELIVHRKGATPAGDGVLGIIPGSMASPCYLVRGKGEPESLHSASHGAGRLMSRRQAKLTYRWAHVKRYLEDRGVTLLSAGIDEVPMVYKDIATVMAAQTDLVETLATFQPRLVKMAPEGEKPED